MARFSVLAIVYGFSAIVFALPFPPWEDPRCAYINPKPGCTRPPFESMPEDCIRVDLQVICNVDSILLSKTEWPFPASLLGRGPHGGEMLSEHAATGIPKSPLSSPTTTSAPVLSAATALNHGNNVPRTIIMGTRIPPPEYYITATRGHDNFVGGQASATIVGTPLSSPKPTPAPELSAASILDHDHGDNVPRTIVMGTRIPPPEYYMNTRGQEDFVGDQASPTTVDTPLSSPTPTIAPELPAAGNLDHDHENNMPRTIIMGTRIPPPEYYMNRNLVIPTIVDTAPKHTHITIHGDDAIIERQSSPPIIHTPPPPIEHHIATYDDDDIVESQSGPPILHHPLLPTEPQITTRGDDGIDEDQSSLTILHNHLLPTELQINNHGDDDIVEGQSGPPIIHTPPPPTELQITTRGDEDEDSVEGQSGPPIINTPPPSTEHTRIAIHGHEHVVEVQESELGDCRPGSWGC